MKIPTQQLHWYLILLLSFAHLSVFGEAGESEVGDGLTFGHLDLEELGQIKIMSVSRKAETTFETPAAVHVIRDVDIRRSGALSLPEALRHAPGVHVAKINSHRYAISIRGFSGEFANKLLVMKDGRSLYNTQFSGTYWDAQQMFMHDIEQIEVVRGPGGVAWGANAVNGVVNVISKSSEDTQGVLITGGGGTEQHVIGGFRYGDRFAEDHFFRIYGQATESGDTSLLSGTSGLDDWSTKLLGFRADGYLGDSVTYELHGEFYSGAAEQVTFLGADTSRSHGGHVIAAAKYSFSEDSIMSLKGIADVVRRESNQGESNADSFSIELDHQFLLGNRQKLNYGMSFRMVSDDLPPAPFITYSPAKRDLHFASFFLRDELELIDEELRLILGAKIEANDYSGIEPLPQVKLSWMPDSRNHLWVSAARAVRVPSRSDDNLLVFAPPIVVSQPNTALGPEQLLAYELGYRHQLKTGASFGLTAFYHDYDNLRTFETVAPITTLRGEELEGESYGLEFDSTIDATDWWRFHVSYTRLLVDLRFNQGSNSLASLEAIS